MKAHLVSSLLLAALVVPSTAIAQRDKFLTAFVQFHQTLRGAYGDEGAQLAAHLDTMAATLAAWDGEIRDAESQLQPRLKGADTATALQVHTILGIALPGAQPLCDALREFEEDVRIDPARAAFHRYKGLIYQATGRPAEAAAAYRTAWLRDPPIHRTPTVSSSSGRRRRLSRRSNRRVRCSHRSRAS